MLHERYKMQGIVRMSLCLYKTASVFAAVPGTVHVCAFKILHILWCATEFPSMHACICVCVCVCVCVHWCPRLGVTHNQKCLINTSPRALQRNWWQVDTAAFKDSHQHVWCPKNNNCCQSVWTQHTLRPLSSSSQPSLNRRIERREERRQQREHTKGLVKTTGFCFALQGCLRVQRCAQQFQFFF